MNNEVTRSEALAGTGRSVFERLLVRGPMSRAELARRLSLSAATLTKLVRPLIQAGLCSESEDETTSTGGRPAQPVAANADFAHFVGFKLTATAVYAVVTDGRGALLSEAQQEIGNTSPDAVADQIATMTAELRAADPLVAAIGVALSGTATRTSPIVAASPFLHWEDVPLATMITERTGLPAVLENDVRAVTAAEQWFGAAVELQSFAVLTLGAGIGCGIVVHGDQVQGAHGASGLVGHLRVGTDGLMCYAGHRGCANAYATTGAIEKRTSIAHGQQLSFDECLALAAAGDRVATEVFADAARAIGAVLATVANLLGPERIFVSGEGVGMFDAAREQALTTMRELMHWTASEPPIEAQPFGFAEWARGAAVVAIQSYVELLHDGAAGTADQPSTADLSRGAA